MSSISSKRPILQVILGQIFIVENMNAEVFFPVDDGFLGGRLFGCEPIFRPECGNLSSTLKLQTTGSDALKVCYFFLAPGFKEYGFILAEIKMYPSPTRTPGF